MPISHKKVGERDFLKVLSQELVFRATGNGKRKKKQQQKKNTDLGSVESWITVSIRLIDKFPANGHVNSNRRANESQKLSWDKAPS